MNTITAFNILCAIVFASTTITADESTPLNDIGNTKSGPVEVVDIQERDEVTTLPEPIPTKKVELAEDTDMEEQDEATTLPEPIPTKKVELAEGTTLPEPTPTKKVELAQATTLPEPTPTKKVELAQATTLPEPTPTKKPEPAPGTIDLYRKEVKKLLYSTLQKLTKRKFTTSDLDIVQQYEKIHKVIQKAQNILGTVPSYFSSFYALPYYTLLDGEIAKVNKLYENVWMFFTKNVPITDETRDAWLTLTNGLRDPNLGLPKTIEGIQTYLNDKDESRYIYYLIQKEASSNVCNLKHSPYQIMYNLYNIITVAEVKAYVMLVLSYVTLTAFNAGDFEQTAYSAMYSYVNYTKVHVKGLQNLLSKTDRSLYACDPSIFVENTTYTRLTKVLQGYIENERNMHYRGSCIQQCHNFVNTEFNSCSKGFCKHQPKCEGNILRCTLEKPDMTICVSKDPTRRYDWVDYKDGPVLGKKTTCDRHNLYKLRSWKRYVVECSYCLCLCDEASSKSDRFFNLRDVTSDLEDNKVVTGVRIVKRNRIIHLQIQQGVLIPGGKVNQDTLEWKEVDDYTINDANVTNGFDYHLINYKSRSVNLNELAGPSKHVVTGVRFQKIRSRLNIGIRVTPVNFEKGTVSSLLQSYWLENQKNPPKSAEITLEKPDVPTRFTDHTIYPTPNQYIRFQPSSFQKDLAQTTVPFIDSQQIATDGVPLSGFGLIYRGKSGSGGFITPKILTYEYGADLSYD